MEPHDLLKGYWESNGMDVHEEAQKEYKRAKRWKNLTYFILAPLYALLCVGYPVLRMVIEPDTIHWFRVLSAVICIAFVPYYIILSRRRLRNAERRLFETAAL